MSASSLSLRLGLCLLSNEFPRQPRIDVEFPNRTYNRGVFVWRFNVADGHLNPGVAVGDQPPVVAWLEAHFKVTNVPKISSGPLSEIAGHAHYRWVILFRGCFLGADLALDGEAGAAQRLLDSRTAAAYRNRHD